MFRATNIYYEALKPIRGPRAACRAGRGESTELMSLAAGGEANIAKSATTIEGGKCR